MPWLQLSEEMAEKNQLSFMQKIKFLCNNSNLIPLTSNTTNEESFHLPIKQYHPALTAHQLTLQSKNKWKLIFYCWYEESYLLSYDKKSSTQNSRN